MSNITELAEKYKAILSGDDPAGAGRTPQQQTVVFVENNWDELAMLNLDQQDEIIRLAGADRSWWKSQS